jgi:hypothetical protein
MAKVQESSDSSDDESSTGTVQEEITLIEAMLSQSVATKVVEKQPE